VLLLITACGGASTLETDIPNEAAPAKPTPADTPPADAPLEGGQAPDFELTDLDGNTVSLASFRGKTVVLEWFNPGCPFVRYAYSKGPLKGMAERWRERGVVWLAINSGAPGKQGHGGEVNREAKRQWSMPQSILFDESGQVGRSYGAKTTPHMFIVDPEGKLAYAGAVDNSPFGKVPTGGVVNYVELALNSLLSDGEVEIRSTQSYGCSVKYDN
jgi:peroxiredoxin